MGAIQQVLASYGASFSPLGIAKLSEWWSIDSLAAVGDGNPISSWVGEKGVYTLGNTGTARPTYDADDGDGKPSVDFDSVDDVLTQTINSFTLYGSTGNFEIWFVLKGLSAGAGFHGIYGQNFITQAMGVYASVVPNVVWRTPNLQDAISGSIDIQDDAWHILRLVRDGTAKSFYLDGVFVNTITTASPSWSNGNDTFNLGSDAAFSGTFWNGGMRHVLFFTAPLDAGEAASMQTYLEGFI